MRTIETNLGASIAEIEDAFRIASAELEELTEKVALASRRQIDAFGEVSSLEGQARIAGDAVNDARPAVETTQQALRTLLAVPGVNDVLFSARTEPADIPDDDLLAAIAAATTGKATNAKRTVREREESARAARFHRDEDRHRFVVARSTRRFFLAKSRSSAIAGWERMKCRNGSGTVKVTRK